MVRKNFSSNSKSQLLKFGIQTCLYTSSFQGSLQFIVNFDLFLFDQSKRSNYAESIDIAEIIIHDIYRQIAAFSDM